MFIKTNLTHVSCSSTYTIEVPGGEYLYYVYARSVGGIPSATFGLYYYQTCATSGYCARGTVLGIYGDGEDVISILYYYPPS